MGLSPAKFKTSFGREGKLWGGRGMSEIRKGEGVGGVKRGLWIQWGTKRERCKFQVMSNIFWFLSNVALIAY